jgi:hypothetical protein
MGELNYGSDVVSTPSKRPAAVLQKTEVSAPVAVSWIAATQDLKAIRRKERAKSAWARLFAKGRAKKAEELKETAGKCNYEQLRRWRTRLDITCMLLFRTYLSRFATGILDIFVFTDGSPQWRGLEMIASSFDMVDSNNFSPTSTKRTHHSDCIDSNYCEFPGPRVSPFVL